MKNIKKILIKLKSKKIIILCLFILILVGCGNKATSTTSYSSKTYKCAVITENDITTKHDINGYNFLGDGTYEITFSSGEKIIMHSIYFKLSTLPCSEID